MTTDPYAPLEIRRPQDGAPMGMVPVDRPEGVFQAVSRVREVQVGWASLPPTDRARRLSGVRREVERRSEEIADRIAGETGKPESEALTEVAVVLGLFRYLEDIAPGLLSPRSVSTRWLFPRRAWVEREPWGVIGIISPWNYPFVLTMEPVITALFGGNGVVLKPSEFTPFSGAVIPDLVEAGGLPEDLVRVVQGRGPTGAALVESGVDRIHFTGSPATGRKILAAAAPRLLPVSLELGGKDPALVLEDANLERAARGIVFGSFFNAGQTCVATERVYVVDAVHDAFVRRVVELTRELRAGPVGSIDIGPMTVPFQLELVEAHLADAREKGAEILCGGERIDPASNVLTPAVVTEVTSEMKLISEETFGPVLPVVRVRDEEEAVERANAQSFGLFASVWTGDAERGVRVARRLRAGGVSINDTLAHWSVAGLPMGGVGESGFSRVHGEEGLRDFTRARAILVNKGRRSRDPWWYPYTPFTRRIVRALIRWDGRDGIRRLTGALGGLFRRGP